MHKARAQRQIRRNRNGERRDRQTDDVSSVKELPSTTPPSPKYQRLHPLSIHSLPDFLNTQVSAAMAAPNAQATPFALANVISVPNFQGSFSSRGRTWPFTMVGAPPTGGA